ncbi:hypothetical protein E2C01_003480 [Portunus trituberculatus]|uniref:Uncharacterized protein n=1 Tax=Portunus trituberculatus TaxID=210409 RepID=A0A5B7CNT1_PORTR|nr:hypothetical protein [Portunus trituberculatus]
MRHENSRAPTYWPAVELSGVQFEISSGAQFENARSFDVHHPLENRIQRGVHNPLLPLHTHKLPVIPQS